LSLSAELPRQLQGQEAGEQQPGTASQLATKVEPEKAIGQGEEPEPKMRRGLGMESGPGT